MRLDNYISENTIQDYVTLIKRDCKPWLKEIKNCGLFYRGMKDHGVFAKKKVRTDRIPMNMDYRETELLDNAFKKKFGWKPRTNGLFVTGSSILAMGYTGAGMAPYTVFPIGNVKYIWSVAAEDLYVDIPKLRTMAKGGVFGKEVDGDIHEVIVNKYFQDTNLCSAQKKGNEVMVGCKTYYILDSGWARDEGIKKEEDLKKLLY